MTFYSQANANKIKSLLLLLFFPVFIIAMVWLAIVGLGMDDETAILLSVGALLVSVFYAFSMYFWGDKVVLRMNDARPLTMESHKRIYRMVENLCIASGLPMPKVYVIPDTALNAFATGRDPKNASIALTQGLIDGLEDQEIEGVIAHELSHVKNYDTLILVLTVVMVNSVQLLGNWMVRAFLYGGNRGGGKKGGHIAIVVVALLAYALGGVVAVMVQQTISRKREYMADANAALMTRYPQGLANALRKISGNATLANTKGKQGFASFYIAHPLQANWWANMFSTHPPIERRIAILEGMGDQRSAV